MGKRRRSDMSTGYTPPPSTVSGTRPGIVITEQAMPIYGRTTHDARLTCPHGSSTHAVFGEPDVRLTMAASMAPSHRSRYRCQCDLAVPVAF